MEHNPLCGGGYALVTLVQRRQLGEHGIIRVGHGGWMAERLGSLDMAV